VESKLFVRDLASVFFGPAGFILAFALGAAAIFGLGQLLAAIMPNPRGGQWRRQAALLPDAVLRRRLAARPGDAGLDPADQ
jgi:hypothetical protein